MVRRALPLAALALVLVGCPESWRRPSKTPGSALWVSTQSEVLEPSTLSRLRELGVGELVATAARLDFNADGGPLVKLKIPEMPLSTPATLAVAGDWESGGATAEDAAARVAEAARQLRFDFEARGAVPLGFHFDLREVDSLRAYGTFLEELRKALDRTLLLSVSLKRDWLDDPAVEDVAGAVDFVVPFLYGQRVDEAEDGDAWDFVDLERKLQRLEELGTPYMLGIVGLGTATHISSKGSVKARRTRLSLQEILWNRSLKLRPGFSLEGVNRRVYAVAAERPTQVGTWNVRTGETIRVVRAASSDIEELMRLLGAWEIPNHLGQVYYRLPAEDERLSLSLGNLLNALDPSPATPDLQFGVAPQRRTGRGWLVRFSISNGNGEITELSLIDSNFIEVRCLNGVFGQRVDTGDFYRFDLYRATDSGELERTFRRSDILRLHVPLLEGQQQVVSGDVEVHVSGEPRLELTGQFLLPDGRKLALGPFSWPDAEQDG